MPLQINGYDVEKFKQYLSTSTHYKKIQQLIDQNYRISYDRTYDGKAFWQGIMTPRELYFYPRFTVCSLYYIDYLAEIDPDKIVDIGCGMNIWKEFYPNLIGIDLEHPAADILEKFDDEFVERHIEEYQCAMTMGAIIFVSFASIEHQMLQFIRTIKPGGRGFMSFNVAHMITHYTSKADFVSILGKEYPTTEEISNYCDEVVQRLPIKLLVVDNLITERYNEYMDGNLRIVFEKPL